MLILLTNDDGIHAPGLRALAREMKQLGDVAISAPATQMSAISSSITLYTPLLASHLREEGNEVYAVHGTPADAVKLALCELLQERPDFVVSGINFGLNTGSNILYSGTVAGALEAAQAEIPAFAVSLQVSDDPHWSTAARIARKLIQKILKGYPKGPSAFNINIPALSATRIRGTIATVQESEPFRDTYDRRRDPRGRTYYWLRGNPVRKGTVSQNGTPTDVWAIGQGYVSVTPIRRDLTGREWIDATRRLVE